MGACDFETRSWGKTAQEAFRKAVGDAQYEHGHGGYTGTIAEKDDFKDLTDIYKASDIWRLFKERIDKEKAKARLKDLDEWDRKRHLDIAEHLGHEYWRFRAAKKGAAIDKAWAMARALMALGFADDKWGPAMCLRVKRGEYLFFGYASS